jgi:hypothetical protein
MEFLHTRAELDSVCHGVCPLVVMSSPWKLNAKTISFTYDSASRMKKYVAVVLAFAENAYSHSRPLGSFM